MIKDKVDEDDDCGLGDFGSPVDSDSNPISTSMSKTLWDLYDFTKFTSSTGPTASYLKPQSPPVSRYTLSHHFSSSSTKSEFPIYEF